MNDPAFKTAAYHLAETTPPHLGQPTLPPQGWVLEGANLVVLLADGRKVRGPIVDQKRENVVGMYPKGIVIPAPTRAPADAKPVTSLPIHPHKPSAPQGKKK